MTASLKLEMLAGTSIETAFEEAIRISNILNVFTDFDFNGIHCIGRPNGSVTKGVELYHKALRDESTYKYASA